MASQKYLIQDNRDLALTLTWGFNWRKFTVLFNNEQIATATQKELKKGISCALPTGQVLAIQLKGGYAPELEILVDGAPLAGSVTEPQQRVKQAVNIGRLVGFVNIGLGVLAELNVADILIQMGFGWGSMVLGGIFLGLSYFIGKRNMWALYATIALLALDMISSVAFLDDTVQANPTSGILVKAFFIYTLYKGMGAIKTLKQQEAQATLIGNLTY